MLTMNYVVTLPADYDMNIIRNRVARLGPAMDNYEYLLFKAFLMTERGENGNHDNSYTPFYVWNSEQGIHSFLSGDGFKNLTQSFGWLPIRIGVVHALQVATTHVPTYATHERVAISPHTDMAALWNSETQKQESLVQSPNVFCTVVAFDPSDWTLIRFTLWTGEPESIGAKTNLPLLTVLHLSMPEALASL